MIATTARLRQWPDLSTVRLVEGAITAAAGRSTSQIASTSLALWPSN